MTVLAPEPVSEAKGITSAAGLPALEVLHQLGVDAEAGLTGPEVERRRAQWGPNAVSSHRARLWPVLWHQLRSPLLGLLLSAATASYVVGERGDALIIGAIVALSVGLGFVNEYRAERGPRRCTTRSTTRRRSPVTDGRRSST